MAGLSGCADSHEELADAAVTPLGRVDCRVAGSGAVSDTGAPARPAPGWDFFVSYTAADQAWAEWVAWQLEDAGYRVLVQVWDFVTGSNWAVGMQQGVVHAQHTVALLSHAYLRSVYGQAEWQAAQATDPWGFARTLLPIRLEDCPRPGLLGQIVSIDLFDRPAEAARQHLLDAIATALAGRAKPAAAPAFPAPLPPQQAPPSTAPAFPTPPPRSVEPWPVIEGEPPLLATAFQERPGVQRRLAAALAPAGSMTVVTQVLAGDGGIGKTQLAAKTFEQAYASGSHDLCLWVTAASRQAIVTGYAQAMARIDPGARADDPDRAARRFLTWLRETDRSWFIVLDDVADPADAAGWWLAGWTDGGQDRTSAISKNFADMGAAGAATGITGMKRILHIDSSILRNVARGELRRLVDLLIGTPLCARDPNGGDRN